MAMSTTSLNIYIQSIIKLNSIILPILTHCFYARIKCDSKLKTNMKKSFNLDLIFLWEYMTILCIIIGLVQTNYNGDHEEICLRSEGP